MKEGRGGMNKRERWIKEGRGGGWRQRSKNVKGIYAVYLFSFSSFHLSQSLLDNKICLVDEITILTTLEAFVTKLIRQGFSLEGKCKTKYLKACPH